MLANGSDPHTRTPVPQWRYILGRRHRLGQLGAEHHIVAYSLTAAEGGGGRLLCGIRKGTYYSDLDRFKLALLDQNYKVANHRSLRPSLGVQSSRGTRNRRESG